MDPLTPGLRAIYYLVVFTIECEQVPDEVRQGLELIRVCNVDLQHLIELRLECLSLLERRPKVLQRVNSIIEAANERIIEVGKIIEKCRPDANKGKTSFGRRAAWIFLDSKEFRSHEPIISRHHASVLAEVNFLRQILLLAPAESRSDDDNSPKGPVRPKASMLFDNVALLGDMMGGLSVSNPPTPAINPALNPAMNPAMNPITTSINPLTNTAINSTTHRTSDSSTPYSPPPPPYTSFNDNTLNSRPKSIYNVTAAKPHRPSISSQYSDHVRSQQQSISAEPLAAKNAQLPSFSQRHAGLALLFDDPLDSRPVSALSNHSQLQMQPQLQPEPQPFIAELPDRPQTFVAELPGHDFNIPRRPVANPSQDLSRERPHSLSGPSGHSAHEFSTYPGGPKPYAPPNISGYRPSIHHSLSLPIQPVEGELQTHQARASISGYPGIESRPGLNPNQQNYTPWQGQSSTSAISDALNHHSTPTSSSSRSSVYQISPSHQASWSRDGLVPNSAQLDVTEGVSRPSTAFSAHSSNLSTSSMSPQSSTVRPLSNIPSSLLYNNTGVSSQPRSTEPMTPQPLLSGSSFMNPPTQPSRVTPNDSIINPHQHHPTSASAWNNWDGSYDTSFQAQ